MVFEWQPAEKAACFHTFVDFSHLEQPIYLVGLTRKKQIHNSTIFAHKNTKSWNLLITGSLLGRVISGRVLFEENPWF
jgi:hypothetical protein